MNTFHTNETSSLPSDGEDNNAFTGATLVLCPDSTNARFRGVDSNTFYASQMESSAVLTGLDDDPTSPLAAKKQKESPEPTNYTTTTSVEYFSLRPGQFEKAVNDCVNRILRPAGDTDVQGSWLLTE